MSLPIDYTYVVQNDKLVGPATTVVANCVQNTSSYDCGDQLLEEEDQEDTRDGSQVEVVDLEQAIEREGWAASHEFATSENDNVVGDEHGCSRKVRRHGRLARREAEVLGLVALDGHKGLFKHGP